MYFNALATLENQCLQQQLIDIVSHHICFSRCGTRLMKPASPDSPDQFSSACIYTQIYTFCIFFQSRIYNGIIIKCILPLLYHMPHIPHAGQLLWFGHGKGHWKWTHPSIENRQQNYWNIILSISEKKYWGSYISIIVDETSDVSKLEQFSISDNYLDCKGAKQERFSKFT